MSWRADGWKVALVAAFGAAAVLIFAWQQKLTFTLDEWDFLLGRRGGGLDTYLNPHHEHVAIAPIAIYKLLLATFGMESATPWHVLSVLMFVATIALVFVWLRARVGEWLALAAVLPLLVFGASWDNVLFPFQMAFIGSLFFGIAALMVVERGGRNADLATCGLLFAAMIFSSLGVTFAVAVAVAILTAPHRRQRAWIVVVPVALLGLWWLGWGRDAENWVTWANVAQAPAYVLDGFASSLASLFGFATPRDEIATTPLDWGRWLLVAGLGLAGWRLLALRTVPRGLLIALSAGVTFWLLAAINNNLFRPPTTERYQLIGAIFVLMIAAELVRGYRPTRAVAAIAVGVGLAAAAANLNALDLNWGTLRAQSDATQAELAAEEIARDTIDPGFALDGQGEPVQVYGTAADYLSARDEYGSPAYTERELAAAPEEAREAADVTLVQALGIHAEPTEVTGGNCKTSAAPFSGPIGPRVAIEATDAPLDLRLSRFSDDVGGVELATVPVGEARLIAIPPDRSDRPWQLGVTGTGSARICAL